VSTLETTTQRSGGGEDAAVAVFEIFDVKLQYVFVVVSADAFEKISWRQGTLTELSRGIALIEYDGSLSYSLQYSIGL
jgi:hypothetical protein